MNNELKSENLEVVQNRLLRAKIRQIAKERVTRVESWLEKVVLLQLKMEKEAGSHGTFRLKQTFDWRQVTSLYEVHNCYVL